MIPVERQFYVYLYRDPSRPDQHGQPQVFYVGKGCGNRMNRLAKRGRFFSSYLNGMDGRGASSIIEKIECGREEIAFELEKFLISEIGRRDLGRGPLVNLTDGGDGASGRIGSREANLKRAASLIGRKQSPDAIAKRAAGRRGKKISAEHKAKIAATLRGRKASAETRAKLAGRKFSDAWRANMSAAHTGKPLSAEHRARLRAPRLPRSKEHCEKISAALTGKKYGPHSAETRAKMVEAWKVRREREMANRIGGAASRIETSGDSPPCLYDRNLT